MSDSAAASGPSASGAAPGSGMFMRAPPPVINIIAPTDSPNTNNNIEPGPSGDSGHATDSGIFSNSNSGQTDTHSDFQCDFSNLKWSSESAKASVSESEEGNSLSTLQVQPPHELDSFLPNNIALKEFVGKAKKRRFYCRRGAVVLQRSPVGRYFQGTL